MHRPSSAAPTWSPSTICRADAATRALCHSNLRYKDRPGAPDRVFATVDDESYERLVGVWVEALDRAGAARAELLHLHHLTPANEAALRAFPAVPIVGQLHGTELALLRAIEAGPPAGWRSRRALAAAHARVGARLRAADRPARCKRRGEHASSPSRPGGSSRCGAVSSSTCSGAGSQPRAAARPLAPLRAGRAAARLGRRRRPGRRRLPRGRPLAVRSRRRSCSTSAATPPSNGCRS